jgi:flavin reductase (DIM6/NTAB) family NADH-FMN oxidoreductase RutF
MEERDAMSPETQQPTDAQADEAEKTMATMIASPLTENRQWAMHCRMKDDMCTAVGDHMIIVAEVENIVFDQKNKTERDPRSILVWQDGDVRLVEQEAVNRRGMGASLDAEAERIR